MVVFKTNDKFHYTHTHIYNKIKEYAFDKEKALVFGGKEHKRSVPISVGC